MSPDNITNSSWSELDGRWCFIAGRPDACVRISILVVLGSLTGVFCLARLIQYHCYRAKNYHQYAVYYIALIICLSSVIHWGYVMSPIMDLLETYLIILQMLILSCFFCFWAFRILQKEKLFKLCLLPILGIVLVYFTACLIWASIKQYDIATECAQPQWLLFTSSQLILVQFFLLSVIYITMKLNSIRTMKTNRFSQKAQLWGLTVMYEVVSLTAFFYDIYLLATKSVDHKCGTNFSGNPVSVSFLFVFHKIIKYIVPQWTICIIFGPLKCRHHSTQHEFEETDNIYWADKPDYKSTFYENSGNRLCEEGGDDDRGSIAPFAAANYSSPILPRKTSSSSLSHQSSPWLKPSQGWINNTPTSPSFKGRNNHQSHTTNIQ